MGLGKRIMGSRDVELGYNGRSAKLSGVGWPGWDVGGGSGMDRKANNNIGMKETAKFLEREIHVRSKTNRQAGEVRSR